MYLPGVHCSYLACVLPTWYATYLACDVPTWRTLHPRTHLLTHLAARASVGSHPRARTHMARRAPRSLRADAHGQAQTTLPAHHQGLSLGADLLPGGPWLRVSLVAVPALVLYAAMPLLLPARFQVKDPCLVCSHARRTASKQGRGEYPWARLVGVAPPRAGSLCAAQCRGPRAGAALLPARFQVNIPRIASVRKREMPGRPCFVRAFSVSACPFPRRSCT